MKMKHFLHVSVIGIMCIEVCFFVFFVFEFQILYSATYESPT